MGLNFVGEETIEVKELLKTHEKYDAKRIEDLEAAYEGGERFDKRKDRFLRRKDIECMVTKDGNSPFAAIYKERMESAEYINRAGGILDWLTAAVYSDDPVIESENNNPYWDSLNSNADGDGANFAAVMREATLEMMKQGRAYFMPVVDGDDASKPYVRILNALIIDDWGHNEARKLTWARAHMIEINSDKSATHKWVYFLPHANVTYAATTEPGTETFDKNAIATRISFIEHSLDRPMISEIKTLPGQHVLNRIFGTVKSLFNREAWLTFTLDREGFAVPVYLMNIQDNQRRLTHAIQSVAAAIELDSAGGEDFKFVSPDSGTFTPYFEDIARLKSSLYETIQAGTVNAELIPQVGRMSGEGLREMRNPLDTLLNSIAWPVVEGMNKHIALVKEIRSEKIQVFVKGFGSYSASFDDLAKIIGVDETESSVAGDSQTTSQILQLVQSLAAKAITPDQVRGVLLSVYGMSETQADLMLKAFNDVDNKNNPKKELDKSDDDA